MDKSNVQSMIYGLPSRSSGPEGSVQGPSPVTMQRQATCFGDDLEIQGTRSISTK